MYGIQRSQKPKEVIKRGCLRGRDFPIDGMTNMSLILTDLSGFTETFVGIGY